MYTLSISFALDLNKPFMGVYQIRRSAISAYLLQIKELMYYNNLKILESEVGEGVFEGMEGAEGPKREYLNLNVELDVDVEPWTDSG